MSDEEARQGKGTQAYGIQDFASIFLLRPMLTECSLNGYIQATVSPRLHLPSDILFMLSALPPLCSFDWRGVSPVSWHFPSFPLLVRTFISSRISVHHRVTPSVPAHSSHTDLLYTLPENELS